MPPGMPYNLPTLGGVPTQGTDYPGPQQPTGGGGVPNVGTTQNTLGQLIQLISQQRSAALPKPLPPNRVQAGDLSRNYASFSPGSNKYNAKVTVAQSVGNLIANVENREEEKKARDIAYDVSRLEEIMRNPTPENRDLANQIMLKDPNNPQAGLSKRGKEIQKALDIDFGSMLGGAGKTDTVDGYIKKARQQIAGIFHRQTPTPQQQQQPPQGMPQQGMGVGGPMGGAPPMPMPQGGPPQQPQPQAQGAPQPVQQAQARPNTIQPMDAFNALQRQMPQVMGFTPEAQLQAQAIQAGLLSTADKVTEQQWHNFETTAKLAIAEGVIDEKDLERLSKDARSDNVSRRMLAIAMMNDITKLQQTQMTAGATNTRTRMLGQIADSRNTTQAMIQSSKQQLDSVTSDAKTQQGIISSKNSSSDQKKAAQRQLDLDNTIQDGLRNNLKQLQRQWEDFGTMLSSPTATSGESAGQSDKSDDGALNQLLQSILQD